MHDATAEITCELVEQLREEAARHYGPYRYACWKADQAEKVLGTHEALGLEEDLNALGEAAEDALRALAPDLDADGWRLVAGPHDSEDDDADQFPGREFMLLIAIKLDRGTLESDSHDQAGLLARGVMLGFPVELAVYPRDMLVMAANVVHDNYRRLCEPDGDLPAPRIRIGPDEAERRLRAAADRAS